ncbi:THAP domain-containing protein 2-like [Spea bombifrons]|uniref:THAP domain-containing protein 2-like n=1 Tax=Spea bombifrons TaxID=233779 RepID=UPI00234AAD61|nr:THAP domain-containing protein 2-like [Spea bombifrons]
MPTTCAASGCNSNSKKDNRVTFHRFPSNIKRRTEWLKYVNRDNFVPGLHTFLCSKHFEETYFDRTGQTVRLRANAVPTIFIYPNHMLEKIALLKNTTVTETEEDPPTKPSTDAHKQTEIPTDHSYCLPSAEKIKMKIYELERKLEIAHKKIKIYQQRERRGKRKASEENVNNASRENDSWVVH